MSDETRRRANDGRFAPKTGDAVLPPRKQQPRDEHGQFLGQEKVQSSKPYSRAIRELLDAKEGGMPDSWDRSNLTEAQALAMIHLSMAKAGSDKLGLQIIDRAEGKVPQAAEDREAVIKAGTGVKMLAELLGLNMVDVQEAEWESSNTSQTALLPSPSDSSSEEPSTSSSESSVDDNAD